METTKIKFKGINRNDPYHSVEDGALDEAINVRHDDGRLEPIGTKTKIYGSPDETVNHIWIHNQDGIENYILQDDSYGLQLLTVGTGYSTPIKSYSGDVKVEFLKRFMIVSIGSIMDVFLYSDDDEAYNLVETAQEPVFNLRTTDETLFSTYDANTEVSSAEGLLGQYFKALTDISKDNRFTGGVFFRAAYKLYDGNYIFHTLPKFLSTDDMGITIFRALYGTAAYTEFYSAKAKISIGSDNYTNESLREIINSIVIFACKFETIIEMSEATITEDNINAPGTGWIRNSGAGAVDGSMQLLNEVLPVHSDFKDMIKSPSWYKVGEYDFTELLDGTDIDETIDLEDFYHDYAVRETMPVNNFTQHKLSANDIYNFNSRLILTDVIQTLFEKLTRPVYEYDSDFEIIETFEFFDLTVSGDTLFTRVGADANIVFVFYLKTSSGTKRVVVEQTVPLYSTLDANDNALAFSMLGYPDARAKSVEIYHVNGDETYSLLKTLQLTANSELNYSYYNNKKFSTVEIAYDDYNFKGTFIEFDLTQITPIASLPVEDKIIYDTNRVQMSELSNPFYFPAENSYQVGTGRAFAARSNTEPLSTGQFGEHPLQVFTTKGIWAMIQGSGDVLYSNIVPVSGEVANEGSIISVGTGVIFTTDLGIFLAQGKTVSELSKKLTGAPNAAMQANTNYLFYLDDIRLVQVQTASVNLLSSVNALVYIGDATLGFDKVNNELIITNSTYDYSYVFNFDSGEWYKYSESFRILINDYPKLYGLRENTGDDGIVSLSEETFTDGFTTILLTSQPVKLGVGSSFKVIQRMVLRAMFTQKTSTHAGFYYFGSSDLVNWQRITGINHTDGTKRDMLLSRSGSKFKYFIVVFAGEISTDSYIDSLDVAFQRKMANKLR